MLQSFARVLELLARHEEVALKILNPAAATAAAAGGEGEPPSPSAERDPEFSRKVLAALALLCEDAAADPDPSGAGAAALFRLAKEALGEGGTEPDYDSALALIRSASKAYLAFKAVRKATKEKGEGGEDARRACKEIM